jgi:diadenosine tetraphosphatase ApaH/serine/threonine PP2A family protein phosphatase
MRTLNFNNMTTTERDDRGNISIVKMPHRPLPSSFHLYAANDFHVGNSETSEHAIEQFIHAVKSKKNSYVYLQGDQLESIAIDDKRFDLDVHSGRGPRFDVMRDAFMELLDPIADKVLVILDGNHERRLKNFFKPNQDIAKAWGTVYANGTLAKLIFPEFRLCAWHGSGFIGSYAGDQKQRHVNEQIALKRKLRRLPAQDCEITSCGHFHRLILSEPDPRLLLITDQEKNELVSDYTKPSRIWLDQERGLYRVPEEERFYLCSGSFLRGYSEDMPSYVEDFGLEATELGYGKIEVKNDKLSKVETVKVTP